MLAEKDRDFQPHSVNLDRLVPDDNFYRKLETQIDLSFVRDLSRLRAAHQADYPPGFEPHRTFGPNLEAWVVYLREVHHLGYQRLEQLLAGLFGLSISQGALVNMLKRMAWQVAPVVEGIRQRVRRSPVIGSDETRARVDGHNHWK